MRLSWRSGMQCLCCLPFIFLLHWQLPCPLEHFCPNPSSPKVQCQSGQLCEGGNTFPLACPPGFFCPTTAMKVKCQPGQFCPENATNAIVCLEGFVCSTDATSMLQCSRGSYCNRGSVGEVPCSSGYFCPDPSNQIACKPGTYCDFSWEVQPQLHSIHDFM